MIRARAATFFDDDDADGAPAPTWIMGIPYTGTSNKLNCCCSVIPPFHLHTLCTTTLVLYWPPLVYIAYQYDAFLWIEVLLTERLVEPGR